MKYWLQHITQISLGQGIIWSLIILGIWIVRFITATSIEWTLVLNTALGLANSVILMGVFVKAKITKLFSFFPCLTLQSIYALLPQLAHAWRGQVVVLAMLLVWLLMSKIDYSHEPVNETFFSTLIICLATFVLPHTIFLVVIVILWLLLKKRLTFRSINAIIVALLIGLITYAIGWWIGWFPATKDIWSVAHMEDWLIISATIVTIVVLYQVHRHPSVVSGSLWLSISLISLTNFCLSCFTDIL